MKIIDFEHHYFSKPFYEFLIKNKDTLSKSSEFASIYSSFECESNNGTGLPLGCEISCQNDIDLKIMDEAGMQFGILSTSDGIESLEKADSILMAKKTNDFTASKIKEHPDRFLGTFCLPTPYIEESLKEIDRAVNELGLKYFHTHSSYGEKRLSDPEFEPIIKHCAELNIPIYIHPCYQSEKYLSTLGFAFSGAGFGFTVDVMNTVIRLIAGGVFDRYPNLKIIIGHMGEFLPYTIARIDNMIDIFKDQDPWIKCKNNFSYYVKHDNIYVSTSGIFDENVIDFAIKQLGIEHILFGADFCYENAKRSVDFILNLNISDDDKHKICHLNGERLLNLK